MISIGSWLPWSSWSEWTQCLDETSACGDMGTRRRTKVRRTFSRKNETNQQIKEKKETCIMPECPGKATYTIKAVCLEI